MVDINCSTSRFIAAKTGMPAALATKIVEYRKETGKIQDFSDLWGISQMNRQTMHEIMQHFVIEKSELPAKMNKSNNSSKRRLKSKKGKCSRQQKQEKEAKMMERIPLYNISTDSCTGSDTVAIYTPRIIESSPSGEKMLAVYDLSLSSTLSPDKNQEETKLSMYNNAPSVSRASVKSRNTLTPEKEQSIRNWLKQSSVHQKWTKSMKHSKSRSRSPKRNEQHAESSRRNKTSVSRDISPSGRKSGDKHDRNTDCISNHSSPRQTKSKDAQDKSHGKPHCSHKKRQNSSEKVKFSNSKGLYKHDRTKRKRRSASNGSREFFIQDESIRRSSDFGNTPIGSRSPDVVPNDKEVYREPLSPEAFEKCEFCRDKHCRNCNNYQQTRRSPERYEYSKRHDSHRRRKSKEHRRSHQSGQWNAVNDCIIL